jgi:spermidine synthase
LESIKIELAESLMPVVSITNELVSEIPVTESGVICFAESVCWANDAAQKEKRKKRKKENRWLNSFSLMRKNKAVETVYAKKFSV